MTAPLRLTRDQVLAHRRRAGALDARLPADDGPRGSGVRRAAWAGLTDSGPRAALLSLHARVEGTTPEPWPGPGLVQLWGPRFSAYVVHEEDRAVFSLGRLPLDAGRRARAEGLAERLDATLAGREMPYGEAGRAVGVHHNELRYAAATGRVLIRWDGARQPTVRCVPPPAATAGWARAELARRYLHVMGPGTVDGFAAWAGVRHAAAVLEGLRAELVPVRTDVGDGWVLAADEDAFRTEAPPAADARLLPAGDTWTLLWGQDRELLVADPDRRAALWTPRVWPGAVVVAGEVVGTWRRSGTTVTVTPWHDLPRDARDAVEREAAALPLPGTTAAVSVRWAT